MTAECGRNRTFRLLLGRFDIILLKYCSTFSDIEPLPLRRGLVVFIHSPSSVQSQFPRPFFRLRALECMKRERERERRKEPVKEGGHYTKRSRAAVRSSRRECFRRCIIWLDVPSFCEIYEHASLYRTGQLFDVLSCAPHLAGSSMLSFSVPLSIPSPIRAILLEISPGDAYAMARVRG